MPRKPFNWWLWTKMAIGGAVLVVGGPMLTRYVMPTEEELFKKYNPDLQKRSLEQREEREQEFDNYVTKLKEYSKSDKHIWYVMAEEKKRKKAAEEARGRSLAEEARTRREEMRREAGLSNK